MRILFAVTSVLLIAGCSASGASQRSPDAPPPDEVTPSATATTTPSVEADPESAPTPSADGPEPCDLLTSEDLVALGGAEDLDAQAGLTAGVPNCQWPFPDGRFAQVIASSSSDWARSLPSAVRAFEESGFPLDEEQRGRLEEGVQLVEGGGRMDPDEACDAFSLMLELQGQPPGTMEIVTVAPSFDEPYAVSGQMCSGGQFTSVMIGSADGLAEPLPMQAVADAVQAAHRRALV